jgi:hypothetical protein
MFNRTTAAAATFARRPFARTPASSRLATVVGALALLAGLLGGSSVPVEAAGPPQTSRVSYITAKQAGTNVSLGTFDAVSASWSSPCSVTLSGETLSAAFVMWYRERLTGQLHPANVLVQFRAADGSVLQTLELFGAFPSRYSYTVDASRPRQYSETRACTSMRWIA